MKRFVLVDEVGHASMSTNPGRPTVRCDTPAGGANIQIGGADVQDSLAFVSVDVAEAGEAAAPSTAHANIGLVREGGNWKLLSVGLLLLDLPTLEIEWDSAEAPTNEKAGLEALKKITEAIELYRKTFSRLPESLANLAPPLQGAPNAEKANMLDAELASGKKAGYQFRYVIVGGTSVGAPAKYVLAATPIIYGRTGMLSYFRDATGRIHAADHQGGIGNENDPSVQ
jgi:hypothetical protein